MWQNSAQFQSGWTRKLEKDTSYHLVTYRSLRYGNLGIWQNKDPIVFLSDIPLSFRAGPEPGLEPGPEPDAELVEVSG